VAFPVAPRRLKQGLNALAELGVRGFNVTVPYKAAMLRIVSTVGAEADAVGAVNTVTHTRSGWHGDNTDVHGFVAPLKAHRRELRHSSALIFGAGGAARAVACALICELGVDALMVVARHPQKAQAFGAWAQALNPHVPVVIESLGRMSNWTPAFHSARIVVNATPVGMYAGGAQALLPRGLSFAKGQIAYDLVYNRRTRFLSRALQAGAVALGGGPMLLAQAARSFELWTGRRFPQRRIEQELFF
jgi:shikimate dehydrogenase